MSGFRIVRPDVAILPLSNGKTITVRRRLTTGEERAHLKRGRAADGSFDSYEYGFGTVVAYLLDWAAPDDPPPVIRGVDEGTLIATLNALDPDDFIEIKDAIDAHRKAMIAERTNEKKTSVTSTTSSVEATSPLPSEPVGPLVTSAT